MKINFPIKVAVVDDEPDMPDLICTMLEKIPDIETIPFNDPMEAFEEIRRQQIRILLTDMVMPVMTGTELIKKCLGLSWHVDCLMISGQCDRKLVADCFDIGARQVLLKPVSYGKLNSALTRILSRYKYWHQTLDEISKDYTDRTLERMDGDEDL